MQYNSHTVAVNLGIRREHKRLAIENGLALQNILTRPGDVTVYYNSGLGEHAPVKGSLAPCLLLQSYHKIGCRIIKDIGVYATLYLIYAGNNTSNPNLIGGEIPISGLQLLPGISIKVMLYRFRNFLIHLFLPLLTIAS